MTVEELTELFRRLGAREPHLWARSQVEEQIPQLARFLFLRQTWRLVVAADDRAWLSENIAEADEPGGDLAPALGRLLAVGASERDLTAVVRVMQWRVLAGLCQLLDDPGHVEAEVADIAWRLFQVDESGLPIASLGGLIESVLATDPSGREMCAERREMCAERSD